MFHKTNCTNGKVVLQGFMLAQKKIVFHHKPPQSPNFGGVFIDFSNVCSIFSRDSDLTSTNVSLSVSPSVCHHYVEIAYKPIAVIQASHPFQSSLPVILASHPCQSSLPVIHASHQCQSSIPVIHPSHPCQL